MSIDMVQRLVVEVDSKKLLQQFLRLTMTTALEPPEEIAVKAVNRSTPHFELFLPSVVSDQTRHFPIILIEGGFPPNKGKENIYFWGYRPWTTFRFDGTSKPIDAAIRYIGELFRKYEREWAMQFWQGFGDGYNDSFNCFDGSVGLGYQLRTCECFPERLAICMVHMYYGK